jgi:hypothetical protein
MTGDATAPAELVGRSLAAATQRRGHEPQALLHGDFEIVEPESLPYGGSHHGVDGYIALLEPIASLFEPRFELGPTATACDGRPVRSEVFLEDTAALLATLPPRLSGVRS